jgi:arylsulfatase A-like enzyme
MLDNTIVVVTSDHGEEFGEHGLFTHGHSLNDEVLHVPPMLYYPDRFAGGVTTDDWVSIRDIPATILDLVGVPRGTLPGNSLLAHVGTPLAGEVVDTIEAAVSYSPGNPLNYPVSQGDMVALLADPWKLVFSSSGDTALFNLREDPDETTDLWDAAKAARVRTMLKAALNH